MGHRHVTGHALLQQWLRGLHPRVRVKTAHHGGAQYGVRECHHRHALMMRKERLNGVHASLADARLAVCSRHVTRCVIERLMESVLTLSALPAQPPKIRRRRAGIDHRRKCCGVGGDHEIFGKAALQPESRHAKRLVLVIPLSIRHVVGRL